MPINEILAPIYVKGKYSTPSYGAGHAFRLYFAAGCTWSSGAVGDEENWRLMEGATDHGAISSIIHQVFTRANADLPDTSHVIQIELWHSIPAADNVLDHLNPLPLGNTYGSGAGSPSAQAMHVFAGSLRPTFRLTFFDGGYPNPQRYAPVAPPTADDGSLRWYFIKSGIPFATQDGIRITREVSFNTGYNKKLARKYGRTLAP